MGSIWTPHPYSAVTTTANMPTASRVPSDTFSIGDDITVVGPSKHRGRTATIRKVGSRRLTVRFHDGNRGTYVDFTNARINARTVPIINEIPIIDETYELASILEQLAITTVTAINTGEPGQRQTLLRDFSLSLERHFGSTHHSSDGH
jgi:hypothetical protein